MVEEIIMFSPEYWWDAAKGEVLNGNISDIEKWGGMGRVVAEVSERLPKYGFHVTVLARKKGVHGSPIYPTSYYRPENVTHYKSVADVDVYAIPPCTGLGDRVHPKSGSLYIDNPLDCIVTWDSIFTSINFIHDFNEELNQKLQDERTIVHGHDFYGAQFIYNVKTTPVLPDLRCVLSIHMSADREEKDVEKDMRLQYEREGCRLADRVHAISKSQETILKANYNIRSDKLLYIPNGVDLQRFRPPTPKEKKHDKEVLKKYGISEKYIAFWGRIDPVKGILNLISAYDTLSHEPKMEYKLVILGIPSDWEYYHNSVLQEYHKLPEKVKQRVKIFAEQLTDMELLPLIRSASIGVFPSTKEAFGLVAIEAQACGLPVVVGDTGGLPENIIQKKTGMLVDGNDASSIAVGLEYVIANINDMADNALSFAKQFSWDRVVEKYASELYNIR